SSSIFVSTVYTEQNEDKALKLEKSNIIEVEWKKIVDEEGRKTGVKKNEVYNLNLNSAKNNETRDNKTLVGEDNESGERVNCNLLRRYLEKEALCVSVKNGLEESTNFERPIV
ncbi:7961_t:CDS:2, partial [Gigaspora rosea]